MHLSHDQAKIRASREIDRHGLQSKKNESRAEGDHQALISGNGNFPREGKTRASRKEKAKDQENSLWATGPPGF